MCIDIVEIWLEIVNGQISSIFDRVICSGQVHILFPDDNLSRYQLFFTKLGMCIDIVEICFGIASRQISSTFDKSYLPVTHLYFRFRTITLVSLS